MNVNQVRTRSALPGRFRLESAALIGRRDRAAACDLKLRGIPGVTASETNPRTGRVLVRAAADVSIVAIEESLRQTLSLCDHDLRHLLQIEEHGHATNGTTAACCSHDHEHEQDEHHHDHSACGHDHDHDHESGCGHDHGGCGHDHSDTDTYVKNLFVGGVALGVLVVKRLLVGPGVLVSNPILFGISAAATIISGYPFIRGAVNSLSGKGGINTDTLVGTATVASIIMRENVTALVVVWLLNLGEYMQAITLQRTRQAIRNLLQIGDEEVWLVAGETQMRRPVAELVPGDRIALYAGERIPVDGKVEGGGGAVNEAPITGESMPVWKNPGDVVYAGTILVSGDLEVLVEKVGADTAVGRLIERVEQAQELRAPIQTFGDRFSQKFVPASFALSGIVFALTGDINRALTMLLVACPCASGLATPTAVSAAIGNGARRGVLIKGGTHLETTAEIDTVVFDKTGTLTIGMPSVERVISLHDEYTPERVLSLAATGELHSQHPLALAVVRHATNSEIEIPPHEECEIIVGRGMHAFGNGTTVLVGNPLLLEQFHVAISDSARELYSEHAAAGETMMFVAHQDRLIGLIGVRDKIRPNAADVLQDLRSNGISELWMFTGDGEEAASSVAKIVGLTDWKSRLLPEEKFEHIQQLRDKGRTVAMVGDGINDAPALALAHVGIAMGTAGSDVAIEAADIALASDDLARVVTTIRLARRSLSIIRQNYAIALGVNSGGIVAGALGYINPFLAAVLHNLSTLLVVANSARLITYDPDRKGDRLRHQPKNRLNGRDVSRQ